MFEDVSEEEAQFHGFVRQHIICLLLFIGFYLFSYNIIRLLKSRSDHDELYSGDEDYFVYRISVWMCACSLAVSLGSVTLLPFSVLGNELLQAYPDYYYIKWLNWALIDSLWNYVFLLSNLCLFILLPFAYFFIESQGFAGQPKGLMTRVYEAALVCLLLVVVLLCLARIVWVLVTSDESSLFRVAAQPLPFVYSCVSLAGTAALLLTTPLGFARIFHVIGNLLLQMLRVRFQPATSPNVYETPSFCQVPKRPIGDSTTPAFSNPPPLKRKTPGRSCRCFHSLKYPLAMLFLLLLTTISILMVVINTLQLLFGYRALPTYVQYIEMRSRHRFGIVGVLVEMTIILYVIIASLCGMYSIPGLRRILPVPAATSMTAVIVNCASVLILSFALPVLARTLGITSFDLLGEYGQLNWLSNFSLVCSYNVVFVFLSCLCLFTQFTGPVRREIYKRFRELRLIARKKTDDDGGKTD